jgi:hypothetical protein
MALNTRHALGYALAVALAVCGPACACEFTLARLQYGGGGDWYANPSSLPNLVREARGRTGIDICDTIATVQIMDDRLFSYPFLYMTGHGNVRLTNEERVRLRQYLAGGGFLWADDNYGMDESFRRELKALFPEHPLTRVPSTHPIYSAQYRLAGLPKIHEHDGDPAQGWGVFFGDELVLYYSFSSDIGDGMEDLDVHDDGPALHEQALRMGLNVLLWFLKP